jgi:hypothetical protein
MERHVVGGVAEECVNCVWSWPTNHRNVVRRITKVLRDMGVKVEEIAPHARD